MVLISEFRIIEGGNNEEISHEVDGTAAKGFFRLKYTDQVPGPGETLDTPDSDEDGLTDGEDADPRDNAITWKPASEPGYAFLEIQGWDEIEHGQPVMTNNKGQVLPVIVTNTWKSGPESEAESIELYSAQATSIDDNGAIAGYASGVSWRSYQGNLPLAWDSAGDPSPVALGVPDVIVDNPSNYHEDDVPHESNGFNRHLITAWKLILANLLGIEPPSPVRPGGRGLKNLLQGGRHRPQRCRQTDQTAGEAVAYVQAAFRGWLKAIAVVLVRLFHSPSTRKDSTYLPHETNPAVDSGLDDQLPARPLSGRRR